LESRPAVLVSFLFLMTLETELDQALDEIGIRQA
jgi:hypothetical protein